MYRYCLEGNYEAVKEMGVGALVSNKATTFSDSSTLLHAAVLSNNLQLVNYLSENGFSPNAIDINKETPFSLACSKGFVDIADFLLHQSIKPDKEILNKANITPFYLACSKGNTDIARLLLESNINKEFLNKEGSSSFNTACYKGHLEIVKLLAGQVDMEKADNEGRSPFFCACWQGHVEIVKFLSSLNIDMERATKKGKKPYDIAKEKGHHDIVVFIDDERVRISLFLLLF